VPQNFSEEKVTIMRALGAEVTRTPEDKHDPHAASYAHVTRHLEKGMLLPA